MKQLILMLSGCVMAILVFGILFSLQQRQLRKTKLDNARMEIMKTYMDRAFWDFELKNQSDEEFLLLFTEELKKRISEDGEFKVELIYRDMTEGVLSVRITETYRHINGDTGELVSSGVIVLEEEEDL